MLKINCKYNDRGAWCKNKNIKRSLFGIGVRCCVEYPHENKSCESKIKFPRPILPPKPIPYCNHD
jgi:hypothetical protein